VVEQTLFNWVKAQREGRLKGADSGSTALITRPARTPFAGLVQASDGNFYGTTLYGGANNNNGTVFEITPGGALTTLYSFCSRSGCTDGQGPAAGLIQATDGNLYGTTTAGVKGGGSSQSPPVAR